MKRLLRAKLIGMMVLVLLLLFFTCCAARSTPPQSSPPQIQLLATYPLSVPEPSGLALSSDGKFLWTISDRTGEIYRLDLAGKTLDTLDFDGHDLEGIAFDSRDSTLWVVEEGERQVIHVSANGTLLQNFSLDLQGPPNSGLEGICLDGSGYLVVLNEKKPGLCIKLSAGFTVRQKDTLKFAHDFSGIAYDHMRKSFWIVSDKSQKVFLWDRSQGILSETKLNYPKAEGVAVNPAKGRLYIVSDSEEKLFVYKIFP